jgi:hypothetical protein
MLQDVHSAKTSLPLAVPVGTHVIVAGDPDRWIYVHEIIGDLSAQGTLEILDGSLSLAAFSLDAGQGLTVSDEPGNDNVARFKVRPGNDLVFISTGGIFNGSIDFSYRY